MTDLLPCPFCGGKASKDYGSNNDDDFHVFCHSCQARSLGRNNIAASIYAWNARTPDLKIAVEALRKAKEDLLYCKKHLVPQTGDDWIRPYQFIDCSVLRLEKALKRLEGV